VTKARAGDLTCSLSGSIHALHAASPSHSYCTAKFRMATILASPSKSISQHAQRDGEQNHVVKTQHLGSLPAQARAGRDARRAAPHSTPEHFNQCLQPDHHPFQISADKMKFAGGSWKKRQPEQLQLSC